MDSREAAPSPVTVNSSDVLPDTHSRFISRSNGKVSSDDEGFLSGEEEFEMAPKNPVDDKGVGVEGEDSDTGPFTDSLEVSMPNDENMAVSNVLVADDGEKDNKVGVLEGGKVVVVDEEAEGKLAVQSAAVGETSGDSISNNVADDSKEPPVLEHEEKSEVPDLVGSGGEIQGGTFEGLGENQKGAEVSELGESSSSVKDEETATGEVVDSAPGVAKLVELAGVTAAPSNNTGETETVEKEEQKPIEEDGLKFASERNSVVEAINVDASQPGETAAKVKETELPGTEDQTILDVGDAKSSEIAGAEEEKPVEEDGLKLTSEGETVVEAIRVDASQPGVAVVGETAAKDKDLDPPGNEDQTILNGGHAKSEVVGDNTVDDSSFVNGPQSVDQKNIEGMAETEIEQSDASKSKENGTALNVDHHEKVFGGDGNQAGNSVNAHVSNQDDRLDDSESGITHLPGEEADLEGSDGENDGMIFGSSEAAKQFIEELERGSAGDSLLSANGSHDHPEKIDGQVVTDSEDEVDTDEEGEGKELFDSAALAALLKAATGADSEGGNITITSQDGSRLFSVERPAGLGSSLRSLRATPRPSRPNIFAPSTLSRSGDSESNLTDEEKKKLEKLQEIRVRFLRLVQRLGLSPDESVAAQVLSRLSIVAGRQGGQIYSVDAAKIIAMQREAEKKDDLDFSLNILVLGKCGVGKSATINSVFGEEKAQIDAFEPGTGTVKEITGFVDGVKFRVFDTPGLRCSAMEQSFNRSILSMVKKSTKKNPPDIVLYVDRLDAQTRDLNDLPLLRTITSSLGPSIWRSAIVTLTHAASAPPDGPSGSPLSYEVFVTQRSHVVQQSIGQAVGDLRMMTPSMMNPVSLVENHPSCRKNREGQKVLPNGQSWKPQLLLLCYSMKILSEASSLSKPQDPFDHRKLFGFRVRSPPLPYMLSSMLQSRQHPKLPTEQGVDNVDSDVDLDDLSDVDNDEEDEYDQLPPFKPLRKVQISKLSREQRRAYFEEFDYRVKLLQKKQWKEELRRIKMMKMKGKDAVVEYGLGEEDADSGANAPVAVPLPDMVLPPSFDSDNSAYRYRFLEPTSQFLARPVLDTHGWDHDCGYDGVNVEHNFTIANQFPAAVTVQITKDKKDFSISLDSSISKKHGENGSSMAGFDIRSIGKQLAYIFRGETKFKNFKKNKTAGGISITFLGENVVPGLKLENQITLGKQYALVGSAGAVKSQNDTAYGANFEVQRRENDFPIGQVQSTFSVSVVKWRGDTALGFNGLAQVSVGRNSKVAVRAGINNKMSGQLTVRTSSSDHLSLALAAIIPTAISIYKKLVPGVNEKYSMY